jgi:hypothetical protein
MRVTARDDTAANVHTKSQGLSMVYKYKHEKLIFAYTHTHTHTHTHKPAA